MQEENPHKPIRFIVPLTAGSGADIAGRIVARHLSEAWKQPVTVEMRPGAAGQIGTQAVVNKLNAQVSAILQVPEVREQFSKLGITPAPMKSDEFARFVREQITTFQKIVKLADIQPL